MDKYIPCRRCLNSGILGHVINEKTGKVEPCSCYLDWKNKELLRIEMKKSSIGLGYENLTFESYLGNMSKDNLPKLQTFINKFNELGYRKSLYFYGASGTQKTTIASIIGKELLKQNKTVFYVETMRKMIRNLGTFQSELTSEIIQFNNKLYDSDLLIIDECFANKADYSVTDYSLDILREFLKKRLEVEQKSIIFISNFPVDMICKKGYTNAMENLIVRNTRKKVFEFKDVYEAHREDFDIEEELWS